MPTTSSPWASFFLRHFYECGQRPLTVEIDSSLIVRRKAVMLRTCFVRVPTWAALHLFGQQTAQNVGQYTAMLVILDLDRRIDSGGDDRLLGGLPFTVNDQG